MNRLEAFYDVQLNFGYRDNSASTFASLCDEADERLFYQVTYNRPTFYIHFYHHGATYITRFDNERMTLNFLIARQNLKIKTFWRECYKTMHVEH